MYTPNLSLTILEFYTKKACKLPAASLVAQNRGSLCDRRHEFAHLTWCPYCKRQCWLAACDFMISAPKEGRASTMFFLDACVCHCLSTLALGCLPFFRVLWLSKLHIFRNRISPKHPEHHTYAPADTYHLMHRGCR